MRGAESKSSVKHFCNYLTTKLFHTNLFSVASIITNSYYCNYLKADSGASKHFIKENDSKSLQQIRPFTNGPKAKLPDNSIISSSKQGSLPLSNALSHAAKQAIVYPAFKKFFFNVHRTTLR